MRPGMTTKAAWLRWPMSDWSSRFVAACRLRQEKIRARSRASLSSARLSDMSSVSIWMPRNVSRVDGPSVLCMATGTPKSAHVSSACSSTTAHTELSGGPQNKKLSR